MYIYILKNRFEEAQKFAKEREASFEVISEKEWPLYTVLYCKVQPIQGTESKILAYIDTEGYVHSFGKYEWTEETKNAINFKRCDRCQKEIARKKIFIVEHKGDVLQVGGECANQMNCEVMMRRLLKIITKTIKDARDEEWFCSGGYSRCWLNPLVIVCYLTAIIRKHGYRSQKEADSKYELSTTQIFQNYQEPKNSKDFDDIIQTKLTEEERNTDILLQELREYLDKQQWSEFTNNAKVALETGNLKMIGYVAYMVFCLNRDKIEKTQIKTELEPVNLDQEIEIDAVISTYKQDKTSQGFFSQRYTVIDPRYGKIWFKSVAGWTRNADVGDRIKGKVKVIGKGEGIIFVRPKSGKLGIRVVEESKSGN